MPRPRGWSLAMSTISNSDHSLNLSPAKAMLGIWRGGAVRFAEESDELGISEGIES